MRTEYLEEQPHHLSMAAVRLVVRRGPDRGRSLAVTSEEVVIGTAESCQLKLTDPTVSRNHFSLRVLPDGFLISDFQSTNGTRIEGRRVRSGYVQPGEKIDIGKTQLRLEALSERIDLPLSDAHQFGRLRGKSVATRRLFATLEEIAKRDSTVLLLGETGVGKDTTATAIHEASPRRDQPFVVVDCGALSPTLLESELFGHERGSFTGADSQKIGAFEEAHLGTLFLDEIGELSKDMQVRLLGAIERRQIRRVGGNTYTPVDIRILAATNRDLRLDVNRGRFREDLYHRLNVISVVIPPLRERPEDIPVLAEELWRSVTQNPTAQLPDELVDELLVRAWPGNIRELRNFLELHAVFPQNSTPTPLPSVGSSYRQAKSASSDAFEKRFLTELLARAGGNYSEAARLAAMDRPFLMKLVRKHGLSAARPR